MKSIVVLLCLVAGITGAFGQSFEGMAVYSVAIEPSERMMFWGMTREFLIADQRRDGTWADTIVVTYKGGNYAMCAHNDYRTTTIYRADSNKLYTFERESDICTVADALVDSEFALPNETPVLNDTAAVVGGRPCRVFRVQWKAGSCEYYYTSSHMHIAPELYTGHAHNAWNEFLKTAQALPFQIVKTIKGVSTTTLTLASLHQYPVDDTVFALPGLELQPELIAIPTRAVMKIKR